MNERRARALVLMFPGTNCNVETRHALQQAGFDAMEAHVNELLTGRLKLDEFHLLALAGGFSYGDDIASGKVAANKLIINLRDDLFAFAEEKLIIGICNGFQILVKSGLLPAVGGRREIQATLTYNDVGHFYCNWIRLKNVSGDKCVFTKGIDYIDLPVAHGEGKFLVKDQDILDAMLKEKQVVFKYVKPDNSDAKGEFPYNPANALEDIAGVCDPTGRIFGLMPHPERYLFEQNHPQWTRGRGHGTLNGTQIFKNAHDYVATNIL